MLGEVVRMLIGPKRAGVKKRVDPKLYEDDTGSANRVTSADFTVGVVKVGSENGGSRAKSTDFESVSERRPSQCERDLHSAVQTKASGWRFEHTVATVKQLRRAPPPGPEAANEPREPQSASLDAGLEVGIGPRSPQIGCCPQHRHWSDPIESC